MTRETNNDVFDNVKLLLINLQRLHMHKVKK